MAAPTASYSLTATTAIIEAGGTISATSIGAGHDAARHEIATLVQRWAKEPSPIIDAKGNIDPRLFEAQVIDYKNYHRLSSGSAIDNGVLVSLKRDAQIYEVADRNTSAKDRAFAQAREIGLPASCKPHGFAARGETECSQFEKFLLRAAKQPDSLTAADRQLLELMGPLRNTNAAVAPSIHHKTTHHAVATTTPAAASPARGQPQGRS